MFCKKCGAHLSDDAQFCKKCGTPVNSDSKKIITIQNEPITLSESGQPVPSNKPSIIKRILRWLGKLIGRLILICIVLFGLALALDYFNIVDFNALLKKYNDASVTNDKDFYSDTDTLAVSETYSAPAPDEDKTQADEELSEEYKVEYTDADSYFEENSTVAAKIDAGSSNDVQNESEVSDELTSRGFDTEMLESNYSMDGTYNPDGTTDHPYEKHPVYTLYYVTPDGNFWTINSINGSVTALPVFYNLQSTRNAELLIAESSMITSYDSVTNKFYQTTPDPSALILKTVDRIDAETLNSLTIEAIDNL